MQKRVNVLIPFVIMLCLGSIYAWSIFVPELKATFNLSTAQTQLIFGTVLGFFALTMFSATRLQKKVSVRLIATIAGALFFAGYFVAFLSNGNFVILWLGIGVLSGLGTGLGYFVSITVPARWYPERKNFITVLMAAGFGAGAIIIAYLATFLLSRAINLLEIFLYMGVAYGILIMLVAQIIREPDTPTIPEKEIYEITKSKVVFAKLILGLFAGTFTGLLVIGNLSSIAMLNDTSGLVIIPLAISLFAAANVFGRFAWGLFSTRISNVYLVPVAILLQSASALMLIVLPQTDILFILLVLVTGFAFGANFVLFAQETINKFGLKNYKKIYPQVFLGFGFAALAGPFIGGSIFDITGSYFHAMLFASIISVIASLLFIIAHQWVAHNKKEFL